MIFQKIKFSKPAGGGAYKFKVQNAKLKVFFVLFTLFLGIFCFGNVSSVQAATTRYLDATACAGSCSNGSTDYSPSTRTCGSGSDVVYSTLANVVSATVAGDTIQARQDTYTLSATVTLGASKPNVDIGAYSGETPTIVATASYYVSLEGAGIKFHGFNYTGGFIAIRANSEIYDNFFYKVTQGVYVRKGTGHKIYHNKFAGTGVSSWHACISLGPSGEDIGGDIYNNLIVPYFSDSATTSYNWFGIYIWDGGGYKQNWNIYNNYITGWVYDAIYSVDLNSNSTYVIKNNIMGMGGINSDSSYYTVKITNSAPSFTLTNNYLAPPVTWSSVSASNLPYTLNVDTETNNLYAVDKSSPNTTSSVGSAGIQTLGPNYGLFTFSVDDGIGVNMTFVEALLNAWHSNGFHGTVFANGYQPTLNFYQRLSALLADGHEVQSHTYSHTTASITNAFTAAYSGADTPQKVTVNATQIIFQTSGSDTYTFTYDSANMVSNLVSDANLAAKHWSITTDYANSLATTYLHLTSLSLGDFTYSGGKSTITLDRTGIGQGFFKNELVDWATELETQTGQIAGSVSTLALPNTIEDAGMTAALKAANYIGVRGSSGSVARLGLGTIDVYKVTTSGGFLNGNSDITTGEIEVKARTAIACDWMLQNALLVNFYTHNTTQVSLEQLNWIAQTIQNCSGATVLPFKQAVQTIRQSPWNDSGTGADSTAGDGIWSRYFSTSWNYGLKPTSPLIDAGTDVGLTTDFAGNHIYGTPDIGGYEYQPPYTIGTNNVNTSAGIRIYADGKYRYTAATSTATTASLSITPSGGWGAGDYSQWMDASIDTWNTTSTYYKKWTESAASSTITTAHTIGDLRAGQYYQVKVGGIVLQTLQANGSGQISFTYSGGYSTKTFEVEELTASTMGTPTALSSTAIRWNFTDNADNETGFRAYTNTDAIATSSATANLTYLDETGLSENTQYTRYVKAYNSYGESASSSATSTYTLADTPTGLTTTNIAEQSITVSVDALPNDTTGSSGYYFSQGSHNSSWIQTNSWQDTGLGCSGNYVYSVKYRNGDGVETSPINQTFQAKACSGGVITSPQNNQPLTTPIIQPTSTSTSTSNIPSLADLTGPVKQAAIQQIKAQIVVIQQKLTELITQLIKLLQAQLQQQIQP